MMWEIRWQILDVLFLVNDCILYYSIQLGRCALLSVGVLALVMLLRGTVLRKTVFLKGMVWGIFLAVPFLGRLKLFYSDPWMCRMFMWWNDICILHWQVRFGYFLGIAAFALLLIRKYRRLGKFIRNLEKGCICAQEVYLTEMAAVPFAAGLFCPRIVVPKATLKSFKTEELEMILLHERTHIRLGHLWQYLFWDMLRALLWPNLFLTICMGDFREDLEEVCDKAAIQESGRTAYEYGALILKCTRLSGKGDSGAAVSFAGGKNYRNARRRLISITEYTPYEKGRVLILRMCALFALAGFFIGIGRISCPRYTADYDMVLSNEAGEMWILHDSARLREALRPDGKTVYIDREAMDQVLQEYNIEETDFWILFGGYKKLPGIGGRGSLIHVDYRGQEEELKIPYRDSSKYITTILYKMM